MISRIEELLDYIAYFGIVFLCLQHVAQSTIGKMLGSMEHALKGPNC